jgi:hypothetical protein
MRRAAVLLSLATVPLLLGGCELLGIDSPEKVAAAREAEGRAIGGACRHAGRAIEDCFALNKRADKSAVFAGWREMNDYMRENKIDEVAPRLAANAAAAGRGEKAERPASDSKSRAKDS